MLISRSVVRRKKNGRDFQSILRITFDPLVRALNDYFASIRRDGQPVTDYAAVLTDLGNAIAVDLERLQMADWAHLDEVANDRKLRRRRDEATEIVHRILANITNSVDGAYGKGAAEEHLALGSGLRKEPELMLEAASHAAVRLADPELDFGELKPGGTPVDPSHLLTLISGPLARLDDLLGRLTDEEKKSLATLETKNLAIERYDATYSRNTNILKAYLRLAGMHKQAERIRPKVRRRRAAEDDPGGELGEDDRGSRGRRSREPAAEGDRPAPDAETPPPPALLRARRQPRADASLGDLVPLAPRPELAHRLDRQPRDRRQPGGAARHLDGRPVRRRPPRPRPGRRPRPESTPPRSSAARRRGLWDCVPLPGGL